jgi:GNAT superfamily N-acetyltransferase
MEIRVRPARLEDREPIAGFTTGTFPWGDYVADEFETWLADDRGVVMVGEADGQVVGMARIALVSPDEAWSQGARVHPGFRRRGVGSAIADALQDWAARRGAKVVRLVVEDWNDAARGQVVSLGFRPVSGWIFATRGVGENSPVPEGNGGKRLVAPEGIRPAPSAEAEPALLAWASGPLDRAARGLHPVGWTWRRLTRADVIEAARRRALWEGRPGWAIAQVDEDSFRVSWVVTTEDDASAMVRALVDRAAAAGVERLTMMAPAIDWMRRAVQRGGCEVNRLTVYALPL